MADIQQPPAPKKKKSVRFSIDQDYKGPTWADGTPVNEPSDESSEDAGSGNECIPLSEAFGITDISAAVPRNAATHIASGSKTISSSIAAAHEPIQQLVRSMEITSISRDQQDALEPLESTSDEPVTCTSYNREGTRLVTGSGDHRIRVFRLDKEGSPTVIEDEFRGHDGHVIDIRWHPLKSSPGMFASVGNDLRLKIWAENVAEGTKTGRRWRCVHSQTSGNRSVYESLSWACPPDNTSNTQTYSTILAAVTRDGQLSLIEPIETPAGTANPALAAVPTGRALPQQEWSEQSSMFIMGSPVARGAETAFSVSWYAGDTAGVGYGPNYAATEAGVDEKTLTLAATAMDRINVYRILDDGPDGKYGFGQPPRSPVAELTGPSGVLARQIEWAPHDYHPRDRLVSAWGDNMIRIHEVWTPEEDDKHPAGAGKSGTASDGKGKGNGKGKAPSGIGAGLAGAGKGSTDRRFGPNQVLHRWSQVAEFHHEGVSEAKWAKEGLIILSIGDDGFTRAWQENERGKWVEFAHFGPEDEDFVET